MSLKALQDYTFTAKYARYIPDEQRRESYKEATQRVHDMHLERYPEIEEELDFAFQAAQDRRVLGSQRALQFGGKPILAKHARIYNCVSSFCDRPRFFAECLWLLLCGCGTGFSVQRHHIAKLPTIERPFCDIDVHVVEDSIEGWSNATHALLASYMSPGYAIVEFDYSEIRPEGSPLSTGNGKAPGPEPLRKALDRVRKVLDVAADQGDRLRPIDAYDIVMHLSDAVLAGGIRRSATICVFSVDDMEMATAKTGNWFIDNPQRGRSNNSAMLLRDETTFEQFETLMKSVQEFGEPGFIWSDSTELIVNPCVTGDTVTNTAEGPRQVQDLVGKPFTALIHGRPHASSERGFWSTGTKEVFRLKTLSGHSVDLTQNHKVLTTNRGWVEAGQLSVSEGDLLVLHEHQGVSVDPFSCDTVRGYLLGLFLGDGNICKGSAELKWWGPNRDSCRADALILLDSLDWRHFNSKDEQQTEAPFSCVRSKPLYNMAVELGCVREGKKCGLTKEAICQSHDFVAGLIAGMFDSDGTVLDEDKCRKGIRITSNKMHDLELIQVGLSHLGMRSSIYEDRTPERMTELPDGKGGKAEFLCRAVHEISISRSCQLAFLNTIPMRNRTKESKLRNSLATYTKGPYKSRFSSPVESIESIGFQEVYDCTIPGPHAFDANGLYVHNCVEIGMYPVDEITGETGWQACNLCEINGRLCDDKEAFLTAAEAAAIIGTCQAGYTDMPYLGEATENILQREALLGVSITGIMDNPDILLNNSILQEAAELVRKINKEVAAKIGIEPAARTTCIKPAGSTSCMLGTASGIHPHHAKRYIRRAQANKAEAPLQHYAKANPHAVEESVWSANKTDDVISFAVEVPSGAKVKNDIDAIQMLDIVRKVQNYWVMTGRNEDLCVEPWLNHNVSNTITVRPDEWSEVAAHIYKHRQDFCGISLLPLSGDKDFQQAPFVTAHNPTELNRMYGDAAVFASGLVVDGLHAFDGNLWEGCEYVLHRGKEGIWTPQKDWIRRVKQFAVRYFEGDVKKCTYCLKDVSVWHSYCELVREEVMVDYSDLTEESDETKIKETIACAGGSCDIEYA